MVVNFTLKTDTPESVLAGGDPKLDPLTNPQLYENIIFRRLSAYLIDVMIVAALVSAAFAAISIAGVLFLGVGFVVIGPVLFLIPFAYHSFLIGGPRSATFGMRVMDIEVHRWTGGRPDLVQAVVMTILFYGSIAMTAWLILAVALFSNTRRCLHDYFSGTVVVNKEAEDGTIKTAELAQQVSPRAKRITAE